MKTPNITPLFSSKFIRGEVNTFADEAGRAKYTPVALKAYVNLCNEWNLTVSESAQLLGVSTSTFDRIKSGEWHNYLSQDQLTRISALIGIYKGLQLLFADNFSNEWPKLPNKGVLYANKTPVEVLMSGGIPVMLDVRRHIDAVRGGM